MSTNHGFTSDIKPDEERARVFLWVRKLTLRICEGDFPIYLIRYSLFSCPWFAIKLHKIMMSDDDCMHDHPWSFVSIILRGGYYEWTPANRDDDVPQYHSHRIWHGPGSILWRPAPSIHKLELKPDRPATTLVITFRRQRTWGFYTARGFVKWFDFIREGRKCD